MRKLYIAATTNYKPIVVIPTRFDKEITGLLVMRILAENQVAGWLDLYPIKDVLQPPSSKEVPKWPLPRLVEHKSVWEDAHEKVEEGNFVEFSLFGVGEERIRPPDFLQNFFFFHENRLVVRVY